VKPEEPNLSEKDEEGIKKGRGRRQLVTQVLVAPQVRPQNRNRLSTKSLVQVRMQEGRQVGEKKDAQGKRHGYFRKAKGPQWKARTETRRSARETQESSKGEMRRGSIGDKNIRVLISGVTV